jgi:NADH-ubiquinone oxidoreductase chain 5
VATSFSVSYGLVLCADPRSLFFLCTLFSVSTSVLIWSYFYTYSFTNFRLLASLLFTFVLSMLLLVLAADLLTLLVAWDLLGFTSLFLVYFYRSRSSVRGGLLTGLSNRLGDVFFLGLVGSCGLFGVNSSFTCCILIILVRFTKSAQVPFSAWLPAAMLAPTPVSALVHSSTLVTAGVYLLYRYAFSFSRFLVWSGLITILVSGYTATLETDIKKIVALSTLSHLGLIVFRLGLGFRRLAFLHLNIHATFKALLFLCAGSVIHASFGSQESRVSLVLVSSSPLLLCLFNVSLCSLCGVFFLSGWASKEGILLVLFNSFSSSLTLFLFYLGLMLTVCYRIRLFNAVGFSSCGRGPFSLGLSPSTVCLAPIL